MMFRMKGRQHHQLILSIRDDSRPKRHGRKQSPMNVGSLPFTADSGITAKNAKYGNGLRAAILLGDLGDERR